jgi:hypothetical protein
VTPIRPDRVVTVAAIVGIAALALLIWTRPDSRSEKTFVSVPQRGNAVSAERRLVAFSLPSSPSISTGPDMEKRCRDSWLSLGDNNPVSFSELARQLSLSLSPADRTLGLSWRMRLAQGEVYRAFSPKCLKENRREDRRECWAEAERVAWQAGSIFREPLAKFASTSDSPEVYAIGFYACGATFKPRADSQCAQLSAEQWAKLEPNNAIPWLYVANAAATRGDLATRDEALFRASQAQTSDTYRSAFADRLLQSETLRSQPLERQTAVDGVALDLLSSVLVVSYAPVYEFCSVDAVADPNRRQVCSDLAEVMTERADASVSLGVGWNVAKRVGWPPDRLAAVYDLMDASRKIVAEIHPRDGDCESLRSLHSWVGDALRYGELGANQRAIAASGKTAAQLAQMQRSEDERMRIEREQAQASAKSSLPEQSKSRSDR